METLGEDKKPLLRETIRVNWCSNRTSEKNTNTEPVACREISYSCQWRQGARLFLQLKTGTIKRDPVTEIKTTETQMKRERRRNCARKS